MLIEIPHEAGKSQLQVGIAPFTQDQVNNLIKALNMSEEVFKLLSSRLNDKKLLKRRLKITFYHTREQDKETPSLLEKTISVTTFVNIFQMIVLNVGICCHLKGELIIALFAETIFGTA